MLAEAVLDGGWALPARIRVLGAVPPALFVAAVLATDPAPWVFLAAAITLVPAVAGAAGVRVPPLLCIAATVGGVGWLMAAWPHTDLSLMVLVYVAGEVAALHSTRISAVNLLLSLAVPIGWQVWSGYDRSGAWIIGMVFAWGCGVIFRKQQETLLRLHGAQRELADKAVTDERRRIAREVHDLVAHSLAVTMLHLTGARLALADGETAEAEAALAAAEKLGRSSMSGIRQAVGLLADSSGDPSWGPEPDERDVATLVDDYRRAGAGVDLVEEGAELPLEPAVGLAVYRIVQESLANAVRHAPGQPVSVCLRWADGQLELVVTNPVSVVAARAPDGHGLVGMRERTEQLGGQFSAAPVGPTWQVRALLPLVAAAETTPL